ncbi:ImmA/IrrE family metallo-endopeptidase [Salinivibrio sp. VYel1]|uniref:ImmA/IrrE family metallo-endopeptidase n=1 Tax=Salinivibrio sp. VYel1 TaxID=2490490 RepID=UPI00128BA979|nr:ImmA/IrrE family metallo-endopeptidase [Salinivibrio sp. VYel1]MPX89698.1 ImmA/IrrE family metallo-endopeptidase [Salinivibrio sp. VYel1]
MNEEFKMLDDFFVFPNEPKSLQEHLRCLDEANETLKGIPVALRKEDTKSRLYKEAISAQHQGVLYRKRDDASDVLVTYWLSRVKSIAYLYGSVNDIPKFKAITKDEIRKLISLSQDTKNLSALEETLARKGIIFVIEQALPRLKTDGSVFINENGHAVIALSLRYNRLDNFWFTLVHELAHLYLHREQLTTPIIEDFDASATSLIEKQADKLAKELMIPRHVWRNCPCKYEQGDRVLKAFAAEIGVHPTIVAGRIRRELNQYNLYSGVINEFDVREYFGI